MPYYYDVDPNFNLDGKGNLVILTDDEAINQALENFINMGLGEYVYFPNNSGFVQDLVFKNISQENLELYEFSLANLLREGFYPTVTVISLEVKQLSGGALDYRLVYQINSTGQIQELTLVKKQADFKVEKIKQEEVAYEGINLENFVLVHLEDDAQRQLKLEIDEETGKWAWGRFTFTNFNQFSDNFSTILSLINGV